VAGDQGRDVTRVAPRQQLWNCALTGGERRGRWRRGRARTERALNHSTVCPTAVAIGDSAQQADANEIEPFVQHERSSVLGVDIANHLPEAGGGTSVDQVVHQQATDALAEVVVVNIDRALDGVAVGRSLAKQDDAGIAYNRAVLDRDTMRKAAALQVLAPLAQIVRLRCVALVV